MGSHETLHKKFLNASTNGLTVLAIVDKAFHDNPVQFIHKFTDIYNEKVKENNATEELHDAYRTLLCYEYQLKYNRKVEPSVIYSQENLLNSLEIFSNSSNDNESIRVILHDIRILQIILYLDYSHICLLFRELIENREKQSEDDNKLQEYFKNVENLVKALNLKKNLWRNNNSDNEAILQEIQAALLEEIAVWFHIVDENKSQEWRPFILLLISILSTFESSRVFQCAWELIEQCDKDNDCHKTQILFCGIINDLFSSTSDEIILMNLQFCMNQNILQLISRHLISNNQLYRKQAQYVLRSIVDYLKKYSQLLQFTNDKLNPPFVICGNQDSNIKEVEHNFFLLLESLEEKQAHLIIPALSHLENLVSASINHKSCGNCFDESWLKCIFTRLLYHDNNVVIKAGLIQLLRMDPRTFNDDFISFITEALRYTFLYDEQSTDLQPQILKEISGLFRRSEPSKSNFIKKFLAAARQVVWSPIPLYYIFEALADTKIAEREYNIWEGEELESVRIITDKCLKLQTRIMRLATQMNIIKCITIYVKAPVDLVQLMKIFAVFSDEELLQRGTENWNFLINYFRDNVTETEASQFVSEQCDKLLRNKNDYATTKYLGILIVLLFDAKKIFLTKSCICFKALYNLFNFLIGADKRPYADLSLCYRAMEMITSFLNLSPEPEDIYFTLSSAFTEPVFNLMLKSLKSKMPQYQQEANIYVQVLSAIVSTKNLLPDRKRILSYFMDKFRDRESMRAFEEIKCDNRPILDLWYALNVLYLSNEYSEKADRIPYKIPANFVTNNSNGKMVSECYGLLAKIQFQFIKFAKSMNDDNYRTFIKEEIAPLSEVKSDHTIQSIAASLQFIIGKMKDGELIQEEIRDIIHTLWKTMWDMNKCTEFWISYKGFIQLIINKNFLGRNELKLLALNYVEEIVLKTENAMGLRYILFCEMSNLEGENIFIFEQAILSSMLCVDAGKINKRIEIQTCCYITNQHSINLLSEAGAYSEVTIRAKLVELIIKMISEKPKELGDAYVTKLISMLEKYKNKRYFGDSNLHRMKHRIMQIILLLQPYLNEINFKRIHDSLSDLILAESNQPSVRIMQEWILVRIYLYNEQMRNCVWNLFSEGRQSRPGSITSLVSIVYHVTKKIPNDQKTDYIRKAIDQILPSCFSQQFIVRLYSQVVLSKLFGELGEIADYTNEYASIRASVHESLQYGNLMTNSLKLFDNFYFATFDPVEDYDLQTIFYEIPRLSNTRIDEWIEPKIFESLLLSQESIINIYNDSGKLSCLETAQVFKENEDIPESEFVQRRDALADIQKKIIPPTSTISNAEESVSTLSQSLRQKIVTEDTGLIIVASLIEGFPNLGGLARTSEIFCARELILKSKKYVENKDFQSLSVTAEKWITISEVKPHEIRNYLLEKKSEGWDLVGAEQTANSISLLDMKFNKKTVLLLGNEKNGIPADLIQLLDVCVEIPQAGVVRSLNVHVTGAICMWQYASQHVFKYL